MEQVTAAIRATYRLSSGGITEAIPGIASVETLGVPGLLRQTPVFSGDLPEELLDILPETDSTRGIGA